MSKEDYVGRDERDRWWDILRNRFNLAPTQFSNKKDFKQSLSDAIRSRRFRESGIEHKKKLFGRDKSTFNRLTRYDFWNKSKNDDERGIPKSTNAWRKDEMQMLVQLSKQYKGKQLASEFNKVVTHLPKKERSYEAIMKKKRMMMID